MSWYLDYTSVADKILQTASVIALSGDFSIKFESKYPSPSFRFMGCSTDSSRIELDTSTRIRVTNSASTSVTLTFSGVDIAVFNEFEITRIGSTLSLFINGSFQSSTSLSGTLNFNRFFRNVFSNTSANASVKYCEVKLSGSLTHEYRNTTGTGTSWIDQISSNNAEQFGSWPTDDSEWVFYSSGAITADIDFTMPQMAVAVTADSLVPVFSASVAVTMPQMAIDAAANAMVPTSGATISITMPQMSIAALAASSVPVFSSSVSLTMPQMLVSVTADSITSSVAALVSITMPQMSVSATASSTVPVISASVTVTMPQMVVRVLTGGITYYTTPSAHIEQAARSTHLEYVAQSTHLEYTNRSTHIEWRA